MNFPNRVIIYTKDVAMITGRDVRYARRLMAKIRKHFGKDPDHLITVQEFCEYQKIKIEQILPLIM